jgi:hypothetical protein
MCAALKTQDDRENRRGMAIKLKGVKALNLHPKEAKEK